VIQKSVSTASPQETLNLTSQSFQLSVRAAGVAPPSTHTGEAREPRLTASFARREEGFTLSQHSPGSRRTDTGNGNPSFKSQLTMRASASCISCPRRMLRG